jgi:hypothetical protein
MDKVLVAEGCTSCESMPLELGEHELIESNMKIPRKTNFNLGFVNNHCMSWDLTKLALIDSNFDNRLNHSA